MEVLILKDVLNAKKYSMRRELRMPQVAASTGSACHAGSVYLSPVLDAMGGPLEEGMGAIRFSLGRSTTWKELEEVIYCLRHLSL